MRFTDDDLKRLKEDLSRGEMPDDEEGQQLLLALLDRLEAAEAVCLSINDVGHEFDRPFKKGLEAWRKEAGR